MVKAENLSNYCVINLNTNFSHKKNESALITGLFEWFVDPALEILRKQCKEVLSTQNMQLVRNLMYMIEMHLDEAILAQDNAPKNIKLWISGVFIFSLVWTIGTVL